MVSRAVQFRFTLVLTLIACDSPEEITQTWKNKFNLKTKGDGPLEYHLGCDYYLDPDGTLVAFLKKNTLQRLLSHTIRCSQVKMFHMYNHLRKE